MIVPAEYAPLAIRTRAAALATASNWIFTFLVVEITPVSIRNIGWKTYVYFSGKYLFFDGSVCKDNLIDLSFSLQRLFPSAHLFLLS